MCKLFTSADPQLYTCRVRSIRLHGVATSIRLENIYWQILDEIGGRDGMTVPQLVSRLYDELSAAGTLGDHANFTSFLRVTCSRYQQLQVDGLISSQTDTAIGTLDADAILLSERQLQSKKRTPAPVLN